MTNTGFQCTAIMEIPLIEKIRHGVDQLSLKAPHRLSDMKIADKELYKRGNIKESNVLYKRVTNFPVRYVQCLSSWSDSRRSEKITYHSLFSNRPHQSR